MRTLLPIALAAALAACSDDPAPTPADAATDAPDVAAPDATPDVTSPDAPAPDVTQDRATTDVASDAPTPDVSRDAAPDATPDAPAPDAPAPDAPAPDATPDAPAPDAGQDGGCVRPDIMPLPDRSLDCRATACPTGHECLSFSGFVAQRFCGRPCRTDCDCPGTQRCGSYMDKGGTHPLCVP
ncbi:MAG: hypothetical protein U0324_40010 [Polyangiales bacterium]